MVNIEVGKFTLESLTNGMYSDPKIVYREYIQNSVDSIEEAIGMGIIDAENAKIDILVDAEEGEICICDNGKGIPCKLAVSTLLNIGSSSKLHHSSRGFRGIGRLGGLSYCKELVFTTSCKGEAELIEIKFDCLLLKKLLRPGEHNDLNIVDVIQKVTTVEYREEDESKHYFSVNMYQVDESYDLLEIDKIYTYISEVAPVPYDLKKFLNASEIKRFLSANNYNLTEFNIYIGYDRENLTKIFKPNKYRFHADRNKKIEDTIDDVVTFSININGNKSILGWYAKCNWYGTLSDRSLMGLRVRKGNILIGDSRTLNPIFNQERFNGWVQGEVFVLSDELIPNARRDDFEQNALYYEMIEKMQNEIGDLIIKDIRETSKLRNNPNMKLIKEVTKIATKVDHMVDEGLFSVKDKEQLENELVEAEKKLSRVVKPDEVTTVKKTEVISKIQGVRDKIVLTDNYKLKNEKIPQVDRKSKNLLKIVLETLSEFLSREMVNVIYNRIIEKLKGNDKNEDIPTKI